LTSPKPAAPADTAGWSSFTRVPHQPGQRSQPEERWRTIFRMHGDEKAKWRQARFNFLSFWL